MNKCRRMAAVMARRLAGDGWRVVLFDLHGCGDSSGDFADADWHGWCADAVDVTKDAVEAAQGPVWLWGMRAGALLIPRVLETYTQANLLLWQPVVSGQQQISQFLRLKAALSALAGGDRVSVNSMRSQLADGSPVEVAGYAISPSLASGLDAARLALPGGYKGRIAWLEVSTSRPATLSPAGRLQCEAWAAAGMQVQGIAVSGPPFWQTQEIAEAPELVEATISALSAP